MIRDYMPPEKVLYDLVDYFSVFSDVTRIRIISALAISEMCVTDISQLLCINQTTVSHQLKTLKNESVVKMRRQGKVIFYSLANKKTNDLLLFGVEHIGL
ncbi:MAG: metalloregulator ArsR/SmtB family transcription factor [Firmicutes bacterium]|nr:metalloregulator ArsR/SmtB family transcription factor [Bacillota bacterium]